MCPSPCTHFLNPPLGIITSLYDKSQSHSRRLNDTVLVGFRLINGMDGIIFKAFPLKLFCELYATESVDQVGF